MAYEVPRLGVELELQLPSHTTATSTWDVSYYTTAHGNARFLARPGIEPTASWTPVRFVTTEPQQEPLKQNILTPLGGDIQAEI